jgi:hypothetical protein
MNDPVSFIVKRNNQSNPNGRKNEHKNNEIDANICFFPFRFGVRVR